MKLFFYFISHINDLECQRVPFESVLTSSCYNKKVEIFCRNWCQYVITNKSNSINYVLD